RLLILFLLLAAGMEAAYRGPWRAIRSGTEINDFISPYVQTRVWLGGEDPYDLDILARSWPVATNSSPAALLERGIPSPYPITGFPLLAPLSALPWKKANLIWAGLEVVFFALFVYSLWAIVRLETLNKGASGALVV